jgi:lysophospholipase L1-like esterase
MLGAGSGAAGQRGSDAGRSAGVGGAAGVAVGGSDGAAGGTAAALRWVGRVDRSDPSRVKFAWQGAGLIATLMGTAIGVKLRTDGTDTVFFQPVIDNKPGQRFEVRSGGDRTVMLGSGLSAAEHLVELYRETEGMYGVSTFLGFSAGALRGAPTGNGRLIEVVGDSISAGYGNLGSEPHPNWVANPACSWTAANSAWYQTYAAIAGRKFNAEVSTIAHSGWGMYRDGANDTSGVLSSVYDNALGTSSMPPWDFTAKASAVLIDLGTNDWAKGDPGTAYETAYVAFIQHVRTRYPEAWLFLTIGSMLGKEPRDQVNARLAAVVAARHAAGDDKLTTFDLGTQDLGPDGTLPTGCDWHPSAADHQRTALILEQQLASRLGW